MSTDNLFDEFQSVNSERWLEQIEKDLKGKDFKSLLSPTADGFVIKPTYQNESIPLPQSFRANKDWDIVQEILVTDTKKANKEALVHLNKGANSLLFYLDANIELEKLLEDIKIEYIAVHFITEGLGLEVLKQLDKLVQKRGLSASEINGSINVDCLENLARTGNWFESEEHDFQQIKAIYSSRFPNLKVISINANLFANAGATLGQQLGISLAMSYEYIHQLELNSGAGFWFNFAIGSNYFGEISKLRAFRRLWNALQEELGMKTSEAHIYCETATRNKTILDAYNNMIRTSTEAMSAIIGGCNELSIKAYNIAFEESGDFSDRIAKNQQSILEHESNFNAVKDMAKGSHFIESLTEELTDVGWEFFKEIEKNGGYINCLKTAWLQNEIENAAQKEQDAFDTGKNVLIGANKHQKADENLNEIIQFGMFKKPLSNETLVKPILTKRLSEELEK